MSMKRNMRKLDAGRDDDDWLENRGGEPFKQMQLMLISSMLSPELKNVVDVADISVQRYYRNH